MKVTTIRELKKQTTKVLSWVAAGECVEVRSRDATIAVLSPPRPAIAIARPDFAARLKSIYGARLLRTTGTEIVSEGRGETR